MQILALPTTQFESRVEAVQQPGKLSRFHRAVAQSLLILKDLNMVEAGGVEVITALKIRNLLILRWR
jgi:CheY-like chemotaxis protein